MEDLRSTGEGEPTPATEPEITTDLRPARRLHPLPLDLIAARPGLFKAVAGPRIDEKVEFQARMPKVLNGPAEERHDRLQEDIESGKFIVRETPGE